MKVAHTNTTSTDGSRSDLPRRTPGASLPPRPTPPAQRLHASMNPLLRDIDWNGHVPTAPRGPVSMTREQVTEQLAAESDDNERWLPSFPGPRRSPEQPAPKIPGQREAYTEVILGYGVPAHLTAFGAA